MSKVPAQKPGRSEQIVRTPRVLLDAVQERFGAFDVDLACTKANCVAPFGYMHDAGRDSLACDWSFEHPGAFAWLNPPFANIAPWACAASIHAAKGMRIAMLVPASVGANWFAEWVHGKAYVLALSPRVTFVGHKAPYPKDLILCMYGHGLHGFDTWRWS